MCVLLHANNLCEYVLLDLMTGQTQLSKAGKLGTSKKTHLLSEAQTQITSTPLETGELVRNTHTLISPVYMTNPASL